ncbi:hypothetical protein C1N32_17325 [Vibrio diazotrophicus]|uniref:Lcl C-terminal domain-containing protein n=2 Tax=Vibrio diazotrophicus TaxID=685 RepID=A0A2J8HXD6_VIBDI|nr:hypothetical protein C1N32_17325 [Vibrio diazotrophicus]
MIIFVVSRIFSIVISCYLRDCARELIMLFKHLITRSAIIFVLAGCSEQPKNEESTSPPTGGNNTLGIDGKIQDKGDNNTQDSGTQTPPPSLTNSSSGDNNGAILPSSLPAFSRKTLTISGSVLGSLATETYAFRVCANQVCDSWQEVMADGRYQYKLQLSQWPLNIPITIEGNKKNNASSQPTNSINELSTSYFKTEVAPIEQLIKRDSNDDGMLDEKEVATLSLNAVNMAFNIVAKHLLSDKLSNYSQLPYDSKIEAVRQYLSNKSKMAQLKLTDSQKQEIVTHIDIQNDKVFGEYSLNLTPEQWADINGPFNTPDEKKIIKINTSQLNELYTNHYYSKTQGLLILSVNQSNAIHNELTYSQQLVLELAAFYQMLLKPKITDLVISKYDRAALIEKIESKTVTQSYSIAIDSDSLRKMGMFDIPVGNEAKIEISADEMSRAYDKYKKVVEENGFAEFTIAIKQAQWPISDKTFEQVGNLILKAADSNPSLELWQHYQNEFVPARNSITVYQELSKVLSPDTQKAYLFQNHVQNLRNTGHTHPLKPAILSLAPERYLKISGRFPKELKQATMSIVLGSRPNPDPGLVKYQPELLDRHPERHLPVELIDNENQRRKELDLSGESSFVTTIALRDIDNLYSYCKPGLVKNDHTSDEMQDTLTIHLRDKITGVELRSVLGSFCEIAKLDQQQGNKDGILSHEEFERLNVGYVSTAKAALLLKSSLTSRGGSYYIAPLKHQEITDRYNQMPRKQVELLSAFMALQANGTLFTSTVDLGERGTLYEDLLALLDITFGGYSLSRSNTYPSAEELQNKISNIYAINKVLIENPDVNISHIIQTITNRLQDSETDQYYFPSGIRPGSWVTVYPVTAIDVTCQKSMQENQLVGLRLEGKGQNESGHWVTIGWDEQLGASSYTLGWDEIHFDQIIEARNVLAIDKQGHTRATILGLEFNKNYYIRVQSNTGSPSALMSYSPSHIHVADSRATEGLAGDDSSRGRDSSSACDPLTGKAENTNDDGILGARYLKLDATGKPLARQDLSYNALPFACVLDAHTGLVWETKHQRSGEEDYTIYDSDNMFVMQPANGATQFGGTCTIHETNQISTDPNQCTVAKQIQTFNRIQRCGLSNWRLPNFHESHTLLDFSYAPSNMSNAPSGIDHHYFPHIKSMWLDAPNLDKSGYLALSLQRLITVHVDTSNHKPLTLVSDGFYVKP